MATVYLIRHSETEYSKLRKVCGVSDPPLSEEGIARAQSRAYVLEGLRFGAIYSSPSRRCFHTLEIMKPGLTYSIDERLREIHFGELEGKHIPDVFRENASAPDRYDDDWKTYDFRGGDKMTEYFERAGETAREYAARTEETVLLAAHNGFINCVLANLVFRDIDMLFTVPCPTCGLVELKNQNGLFSYRIF